jgi:predicted ATP-dependent endonuclease of OLD family
MSKYHLIFEKNRNIDEIKSYFLDEEREPIKYLPNFNKINIIVGANNSGKSRFMRYLMSNNRFIGIDEKLFIKYNHIIKQLFNKGGNYSTLRQLQLNTENENLIKHNNALSSDYFGVNNPTTLELKRISDDLIQEIEILENYFIPTLQTAHSLFDINKKKIEKDIFLETINNNYNLSESKYLEIFTGMNLYTEILNARNSKKEVRKPFEDFEKFISYNFFEGKTVDIVAQFKKEVSSTTSNQQEVINIHISGENESRDLYKLGDGIQAIIILMYKIFMAVPNSFIYIDEPELNLHPGMQRLFLEQICDNIDLKKKNLTYIISTHSNHLLDLTIEKEDVSIYSFSPKNNENGEKQFTIKNVNAGDNQILKNLGVNNSSVFMANCSIWVEGISDRNYIKAFLKSYCDFIKKPFPKEDIDFAFFEYAGSNYVHYNFSDEEDSSKIKAFALNNRILFLSDVDDNKNEKHKFLNEIAKENFNYKTTYPFREIENLLPNEIWKKVLIEFRNKKSFKNDENGTIQEKINKSLDKYNSLDDKANYIGVFLKKLKLTELNKIWIGTDSKPQTFAYKTDLSNLILDKVYNKTIIWDDFKTNPVIVKLTEEIYNFILNK